MNEMDSRSDLKHDLTDLRGLVMPADWDEKGNIVSIAFLTFDEDEYLLENDEKTKELLRLIRQEVMITGFVREIYGKKSLKIKSYDPIRSP